MKTVFLHLILSIYFFVNGYSLLCVSNEITKTVNGQGDDLHRVSRDETRYTWLPAHGDYAQLKLIVRSKKMDYDLGERVWLKFFVRNDSDSEVHIYCTDSTELCMHLWKFFHSNYDEVVKTSKWEEEFQKRKQQRWHNIELGMVSSGNRKECINLHPGQEYQLPSWMCLNDLFDLSKPDTYELTCFTTSVIRNQKYEPPLQSNTLTFRVLEEPSQEPTNVRESSNAPYTNPLPGEEVFKQPKPPKNVFYVHTNTEPYIEYLDVSPYTYYRERAKEQDAQVTPPPDKSEPSVDSAE